MVLFEKYKTILIGMIVALLAILVFLYKPKDELIAQGDLSNSIEESFPQEVMEETEAVVNHSIYVDVKGAVQSPGLYKAEEHHRVHDMIEKAGGLDENADENQINFAQKVTDEMVIYVPFIGEEINEIKNSFSSNNGSSSDKVNINEADLSELETLPGIGPAKAKAIIDYREEQGDYKSIEDIQNVSGIGAKTFEKLAESITVK